MHHQRTLLHIFFIAICLYLYVLPFYNTFAAKVCEMCGGKGKIKPLKGRQEPCKNCNSTGKIPVPMLPLWDKKVHAGIWKALKKILENPNIKKVGQNIKYEYQFFKLYNIELDGVLFDTMLAHYLLDENAKGKHGLTDLALKFTDMGNYSNELYQALGISGGKDLDDAIRASHQLMSYVARRYSRFTKARIASF